jgi:L-amino acid N-acyltransferase YncA
MHAQPDVETLDVLINSVEGAIAGIHHVWVAEAGGRIIGATVVIPSNASLAHLRFIFVTPDFTDRFAVTMDLVQTAIRDARERGYLKLVVHTDSPPSRLAIRLHDLGFEFSRERSVSGEHVLEFYQNLYERSRPLLPQEGRVEGRP